MLDYVPAQLRVRVIRSPFGMAAEPARKLSCRRRRRSGQSTAVWPPRR